MCRMIGYGPVFDECAIFESFKKAVKSGEVDFGRWFLSRRCCCCGDCMWLIDKFTAFAGVIFEVGVKGFFLTKLDLWWRLISGKSLCLDSEAQRRRPQVSSRRLESRCKVIVYVWVRNGRTFAKRFSVDRPVVFFSGILEMTVSREFWWGGDLQWLAGVSTVLHTGVDGRVVGSR